MVKHVHNECALGNDKAIHIITQTIGWPDAEVYSACALRAGLVH